MINLAKFMLVLMHRVTFIRMLARKCVKVCACVSVCVCTRRTCELFSAIYSLVFEVQNNNTFDSTTTICAILLSAWSQIDENQFRRFLSARCRSLCILFKVTKIAI